MRILFDCSNITVGGGIQVANSFIIYAAKSAEIEYCFLLSRQVFESLDGSDEIVTKDINLVTTNHFTLLPGHQSIKRIRDIEQRFEPDVTFTLFGPAYWKSKSPHLVGFARPHYILHHSPFYQVKKNKKLIRYMYLLEVIHNYLFRKNADYLFVENESMVDTLASKYSKKVYYVPNTYNQVFEGHKPRKMKRIGPVFRLLTISSNYPHKNLDNIPSVAKALRERYPDFKFHFVVTIPNDEEHQDTDFVSYIGAVAIELCPGLYHNADAMYLPTLLECFSASYVEAMFMKLPILTSNLDFARSICGAAALYFDPLDPYNIADTIYRLANNHDLYERLTEFGNNRLEIFGSPEDRYERFVQLFHQIK